MNSAAMSNAVNNKSSNKLFSFVKNWWPYLIGFAIFAYLLSKINISATVSAISSANIFFVVVAYLLIIPMFILKALRWRYMMKQQGINYNLKESVSMYFAAMYVGFITPRKVAELLKAAYLVRDGYSFGRSFFSVFFDRLADLLFLAVIGYVGLFFFQNLFRNQILWLSLLAAVELVVAFVLLVKKEWAKSLLQSLLKKVAPTKYKDSVHVNVNDFYASLKTFNFKATTMVLLLTSFSYLFFFIMAILLAESLGIKVSYFLLIVSVTVATLVTLLPVSIAGVGTRDASLLLMLGSLGVSKESIIAYSTLLLLASLVIIAICVPFWFKRPIKF